MPPQKTRCTAVTANGQSCRAWAIHNSKPPRCAPHSGLVGAPKGNKNAVTHGYYRQRIQPGKLLSLYQSAGDLDPTQKAILLRVLIYRLSSCLNDPELPLKKVSSIALFIISASHALTMVQKQPPDPNALDLDTILDNAGAAMDWDL